MSHAWAQNAACRGLDTNLFFSTDPDDQDAAIAVCSRCPVTRACRDDAIATDQSIPYGIRAGLTPRQRRLTVVTKKPRLAQAERDEAKDITRILTARGVSSREIAARLGVDKRTVLRWRHEYREAA